MKLDSIEIKNFKGFSHLNLKLDKKSAIIFGINGTGKSTILSAINYCFWPWLNRVNPAQSTAYRTFAPELVHQGTSTLHIECGIYLEDNFYEIHRTYIKASTAKKAVSLTNNYKEFVEAFNHTYLDESKNMPIFVNYGTNRAVFDIPLRISKKHQFSKLTALERAIENQLDFRTFFEWYRNQEDIENEHIRDSGDRNYQDPYLKCVRHAVEVMLGNVKDLKVKRNPLRMTVKKNGVEISVDLLSDGEKCTIALLGDLARRVSMANPNRDNPLEGSGVVLIDEIELHMHPSWQRRILDVLQKVFPNIQFIITTHSPQVLGEVGDDYNVIKLNVTPEGEGEVERISTYGKDSSWILQHIMGSEGRNRLIIESFHAFYKAVDDMQYDTAQKILDELTEKIGDDSELTAMQVQLDMERL